jgi:hypothetical protein
MRKFVIQREYLLPVYQYLVIEADTFEEACAEAVGPEHDWDNAEEDYDGSLPTTITNAKVLPEGATTDHYLIEGSPLTQRMPLGSFLYENEAETGPLLPIYIAPKTDNPTAPQWQLGGSRRWSR